MKSLVLAALLLVSANVFAASPAEKPSRALVDEYVTLIGFEGMMNTSINTYDQQLFGSLPPNERAEARKLMASAIGWPAIKEQVYEIITSTYTREEIQAYIDFIKSPVGASANAKNDLVTQKLGTIMSANVQKALTAYYQQKQLTQQK